MTASTQSGRMLDDVQTVLAAQADPQTLRRLIPASVRLLAEGKPVSPAQIAEESGAPPDQAETALRGVSDIEWTTDGRSRALASRAGLPSTSSASVTPSYTPGARWTR